MLRIPKLQLLKKIIFTIYKNGQKKYKSWWRKNKKKTTFIKIKKLKKIDDIDVNNKLISKKEPYVTKNSFKYFIGYNDNDIIRPLCIKLPQMTGYARKFNENVTMSCKVNDKQLLKNYNRIWEKIEN